MEAINKAIELKPDYPDAWYNKACIYSLKGDRGNALKHLSKAIELNPEYKELAILVNKKILRQEGITGKGTFYSLIKGS